MSSTVVKSKQFVRTVSANSPARISEADFAGFWQQWWWVFVKGFHILEFALLTFLLLRATCGRLLSAALLAVGMAVVDEFHQSFVPARGGHLSDVAIDSIGIGLAVAAWQFFVRRGEERRQRETS